MNTTNPAGCIHLLLDAVVAVVGFALAWAIAGPRDPGALFDNDGYEFEVPNAWLRLGAVLALIVPALRLARLGVTPWAAPLLLVAQLRLFVGPDWEWIAASSFPRTILPLIAPALLCVVTGVIAVVAWWRSVRASGWTNGDRADIAAMLLAVPVGWWIASWPDAPPIDTVYIQAAAAPALPTGIAAAACLAVSVPLLRLARSRRALDVLLGVPLVLLAAGPWYLAAAIEWGPEHMWSAVSRAWGDVGQRTRLLLMLGPDLLLLIVLLAVAVVASATALRSRPNDEWDEDGPEPSASDG